MEKDAIVLNDVKNEKKFYAVCCKCGHVRPTRYVEITFAIIADNGKEAAEKARRIARVKHNKKYAILSCKEISKEEFDALNESNRNDPYLKCTNVQEQRLIEGFESRILNEPEVVTYKKSKKERKDLIEYKLKKQNLCIKELNETMLAF